MTGALPKQIARFVVARIACHETNRDINVQFSNSVESLRPIKARHLDVEENDRDLAAVITAMMESFRAVGRGPYVEALVLQKSLQDIPKCRLVIDHENATTLVAVVTQPGIAIGNQHGLFHEDAPVSALWRKVKAIG